VIVGDAGRIRIDSCDRVPVEIGQVQLHCPVVSHGRGQVAVDAVDVPLRDGRAVNLQRAGPRSFTQSIIVVIGQGLRPGRRGDGLGQHTVLIGVKPERDRGRIITTALRLTGHHVARKFYQNAVRSRPKKSCRPSTWYSTPLR
jgi:hypothetical protein